MSVSAVLTKKSRHQPTSLQVRMPANNTQGRAAKRNTQGGKAFKSQKKGDEGFRARAAREAAEEMLDLILKREKVGLAAMKGHEVQALLEIQVGRVNKKFGNGRFEVLCQDNTVRNCALRGLLKRKGQTHVDIGDIIVVALSEPLEEMDSSDDRGSWWASSTRLPLPRSARRTSTRACSAWRAMRWAWMTSSTAAWAAVATTRLPPVARVRAPRCARPRRGRRPTARMTSTSMTSERATGPALM